MFLLTLSIQVEKVTTKIVLISDTILTEISELDELFNLKECKAEESANGLVRCLSPEQARCCGFSLPFGLIYFCSHDRREEIVKDTSKVSTLVNGAGLAKF